MTILNPAKKRPRFLVGGLVAIAAALAVYSLSADIGEVAELCAVRLRFIEEPQVLSERKIERQLRAEFDHSFPAAFEAYRQEILSYAAEAKQSLTPLRQAVGASLQDLLYELDGYAGRTKEDKPGLILASIREIGERPAIAVLGELGVNTAQAWENFCELFGAQAPAPGAIVPAFPKDEVKAACAACAENLEQSLLLKMADDAFEWVPVVGDIYGFMKIGYDPGIDLRVNQPAAELAASTCASVRGQIDRFVENYTQPDMVRAAVERAIDLPGRAREIQTALLCSAQTDSD